MAMYGTEEGRKGVTKTTLETETTRHHWHNEREPVV